AFHTLAPLYGLPALVLEPVLGLVATYNVFFLSTFFLSALSAWWVARRLTGSEGGAFLAGAVFAFSPYHMAHGYHLNLLTIEFLPIAAWASLRLIETGSRRHAIVHALAADLSFYACLEYALASALLFLTLLGFALLPRDRKR